MARFRPKVAGMVRGIDLDSTEEGVLAGFEHGLDVHGEGEGGRKCDSQVSSPLSCATQRCKIPSQGVVWKGAVEEVPVEGLLHSGVWHTGGQPAYWRMKRFGSCQHPGH